MISLTSPCRTRFHDLPAGPKLLLLCLFSAVLFSADSLAVHLSALCMVCLLYCFGGIRFLKAGLRSLFPLWPFLAVLAVWHAITGTFISGFEIAAKLLATIGMANLVTMTTRLDHLLGFVHNLTSPFRRGRSGHSGLDLAVALVVRFTPTLARKGEALSLAWKARSTRRPNWRVVVPFTLSAIDDAEKVAEAIRARSRG